MKARKEKTRDGEKRHGGSSGTTIPMLAVRDQRKTSEWDKPAAGRCHWFSYFVLDALPGIVVAQAGAAGLTSVRRFYRVSFVCVMARNVLVICGAIAQTKRCLSLGCTCTGMDQQ